MSKNLGAFLSVNSKEGELTMKMLVCVAASVLAFIASFAEIPQISMSPAKLEFRLVHKANAKRVAGYEAFLAAGNRPEAYADVPEEAEFLTSGSHRYLVEKQVLLDESAIASAYAAPMQFCSMADIPFKRSYVLSLTMTETGSERFAELTKENVGRQLAIVVDGRLLSAPMINDQIDGPQMTVTGEFSREEAEILACRINLGKRPK